jgi:hypothetical protein
MAICIIDEDSSDNDTEERANDEARTKANVVKGLFGDHPEDAISPTESRWRRSDQRGGSLTAANREALRKAARDFFGLQSLILAAHALAENLDTGEFTDVVRTLEAIAERAGDLGVIAGEAADEMAA